MAGGDAALIKSVEDFEDHPEFAEQQLMELGFKDNDLLIGSTEGGETSWVIGAVWKATHISKRKPYILYGNPDEVLVANVERSKKFIESEQIHKINMNVGSMAIAGSTRMQSTTILMYGIGLTLLGCDLMRKTRGETFTWKEYAAKNVETFLEYIKKIDFSVIAKLIEYESGIYKKGEQVSYVTDQYYAISILTDTTERAPTFSLNAFENVQDSQMNPCWCNMVLVEQHPKEFTTPEDRVKSNWE
jgi:N-acetylmuramic acid 6-phosphate etherase